MTKKQDETFNFEENLKKLENIVHTMENDPLDLDEALKQFETGINLTRKCESALKKAEQRVETIMQDKNNA
jgi:exodeoxyribonuclease VII small subunit